MPVCPICGFPELKEPPRAPSGGGSYEICPCCGFQFGVDDDDRGISDEQARERWIEKGMPWYSKSRKAPVGWDGEKQVQKVLKEEKRKSEPKPKVKTVKKVTATKSAEKTSNHAAVAGKVRKKSDKKKSGDAD